MIRPRLDDDNILGKLNDPRIELAVLCMRDSIGGSNVYTRRTNGGLPRYYEILQRPKTEPDVGMIIIQLN